jgi:hypothetical protein
MATSTLSTRAKPEIVSPAGEAVSVTVGVSEVVGVSGRGVRVCGAGRVQAARRAMKRRRGMSFLRGDMGRTPGEGIRDE